MYCECWCVFLKVILILISEAKIWSKIMQFDRKFRKLKYRFEERTFFSPLVRTVISLEQQLCFMLFVDFGRGNLSPYAVSFMCFLLWVCLCFIWARIIHRVSIPTFYNPVIYLALLKRNILLCLNSKRQWYILCEQPYKNDNPHSISSHKIETKEPEEKS